MYQHDKSDSSSKNRFLFHHLRQSYETVRPVWWTFQLLKTPNQSKWVGETFLGFHRCLTQGVGGQINFFSCSPMDECWADGVVVSDNKDLFKNSSIPNFYELTLLPRIFLCSSHKEAVCLASVSCEPRKSQNSAHSFWRCLEIWCINRAGLITRDGNRRLEARLFPSEHVGDTISQWVFCLRDYHRWMMTAWFTTWHVRVNILLYSKTSCAHLPVAYSIQTLIAKHA